MNGRSKEMDKEILDSKDNVFTQNTPRTAEIHLVNHMDDGTTETHDVTADGVLIFQFIKEGDVVAVLTTAVGLTNATAAAETLYDYIADRKSQDVASAIFLKHALGGIGRGVKE